MSRLGDRLIAIDRALDGAGLAHAFGGAIALAYCTGEPRATQDLDLNIFVPTSEAGRALAALPDEVAVTATEARALEAEGQVRLWWEKTPVDLFLNVHPFHATLAARVARVPFEGQQIPVLDCTDLAVFKALFGRTKDWADIEAMIEADKLDVERAAAELERDVGRDHPASVRLLGLAK